MKKIMMTMAAALMAVTMNAQSMYVGGSLGYSTSSYDGSTLNTKFSFIPEFGYRFNDKMGLGIEFGYSSNKNEAKDPTVTTTDLTVAPYFRYTAINMGKVSLFADGMFKYVSSKDELKDNKGNKSESTVNSWGLYVQPGIAYSLNDKFSLVAKLGNVIGYTSSKPDVSGAKATSTFQLLNLTNNIQFGCYYNF